MLGTVFDIKQMTLHDGPGVRTTVFLKGCPLRCLWCHNPEGLSAEPQLFIEQAGCTGCGRCRLPCAHERCRLFGRCTQVCPQGLVRVAGEQWRAEALARELKKDADLLAQLGGGVTVSGGEPLMQGDFLLELLGALRPVHTAVQTCGYGDTGLFLRVMDMADLILFDTKIANDAQHRRFTGVSNRLIRRNLEALINSDRPFIARMPLILGITDTQQNREGIAGWLGGARRLVRLELLPYNALAGAKYASVGMEYAPPFDEKQAPDAQVDWFIRQGIRTVLRGG